MIIIYFIGRIIFGIFWLNNAWGHLVSRRKDMIGYARSVHVPAPALAIVGTGILLLIGGLSIVLGFWPHIGLLAILLFLLGVTFKMHAYWNVTDPGARMGAQINFWKNIALIGATAMMFAIPLPWPWSI